MQFRALDYNAKEENMAGSWRMEKSCGFIQMWFTLLLGVLQVIPTYIDTARAQTEGNVK